MDLFSICGSNRELRIKKLFPTTTPSTESRETVFGNPFPPASSLWPVGRNRERFADTPFRTVMEKCHPSKNKRKKQSSHEIQYFPELDDREDELRVDDIRSGTSESSSGKRKQRKRVLVFLGFSKDKQGRAISDQPWIFITSHHSPTCFPE